MSLRRYCQHCGWSCVTETTAENDQRLALHESIMHADDRKLADLPKLEPLPMPVVSRLAKILAERDTLTNDLQPSAFTESLTADDCALLRGLGISGE